jgi:hypothetical protein
MSPPAYANAAGGGGEVVSADTATLPLAAAQWRGLLDTSLAAPPQLPVYDDAASQAAATLLADALRIHDAMTTKRNAAGDQMVAASNGTSQIIAGSDHSGAGIIASSAGPSSSGSAEPPSFPGLTMA